MKKESVKSILLPLILIPAGGILVLILCYLLYYGFVLSMESFIFTGDPQRVPVGNLRVIFTAILLAAGVVVLCTKWPDLLKVILLTGPVGTLLITVILTFYQQLPTAYVLIAVILAGLLFPILRYKKPWLYTYALLLATLAAIFYGYPR